MTDSSRWWTTTILTAIPVALSLLFPFAYLAGQAYYSALLNTLGVPDSLVPVGTDIYLRYGFESLFGFAMLAWDRIDAHHVLALLILGSVIALLKAAYWFAISTWPRLRVDPRALRARLHRKVESGSEGLKDLLKSALAAAFVIAIPFLLVELLITLSIPAFIGRLAGENEGHAFLRQLRGLEGTPFTPAIATFAEGDIVRSLPLLLCAADACILIDGKQFSVVPKSAIRKVVGPVAVL